MAEGRKRLKDLLASGRPILAPGAVNALTARMIEEAGFEVVYLTGAGLANAMLAAPDLGLLSFGEVLTQARYVVQATSLPVIVDADTGFGNALNVRRTVQELEQAGAAALQLEDQVFPKRCGHFAGKEVVPAAEMAGKIRAAVEARRDPNLVIIARTDAIAVEGFAAAIARARLYRDAGADALFLEAPGDLEQMRAIGKALPGIPLVANMVEGGKTPVLPLETLHELGFTLVLYANTALRAQILATQGVLRELRQRGSSLGLEDRFCSWAERQRLVRLPEHEALERRYAGN